MQRCDDIADQPGHGWACPWPCWLGAPSFRRRHRLSLARSGLPSPQTSAPRVVGRWPTWPPVPEGFYRVRRGDTLVGIALEHGVDWRELSQWNQIDNPNLIDVGQVLRVREPKPERPASSNTLAQSEPIPEPPVHHADSAAGGSTGGLGMSSDQPPAANETITEVAPAVEPGLPAAPADPTMGGECPTSVPEQAATPW